MASITLTFGLTADSLVNTTPGATYTLPPGVQSGVGRESLEVKREQRVKQQEVLRLQDGEGAWVQPGFVCASWAGKRESLCSQ